MYKNDFPKLSKFTYPAFLENTLKTQGKYFHTDMGKKIGGQISKVGQPNVYQMMNSKAQTTALYQMNLYQ